jgi:hypothetical protein
MSMPIPLARLLRGRIHHQSSLPRRVVWVGLGQLGATQGGVGQLGGLAWGWGEVRCAGLGWSGWWGGVVWCGGGGGGSEAVSIVAVLVAVTY